MNSYSIISISTLVLTVFSQTAFTDEKNTDNSGMTAQIRFGHTTSKDSMGGHVSTHAIGGRLGFISPTKKGLNVGGKLYSTHPIGEDNDALFLASDGDGYSLMGELWLQAEFIKTTVKIGRQAFDTPFADTNDIGMVPNTFEGIVITNTALPNTTIVAAYLDQWAGVDAGTPEKFTDMNGSDGIYTLGGMYELDKWNAQLWHYKQDNATDMTYAEVSINPTNNLAMGLQYIAQKDNAAGGKGKAWGTTAAYTLADVTFSADYNKTLGTNGVLNGFGGGPYFTSAEQNTIDGIANICAHAIGIEYAGINNLTLGIRKIDFDQGVGDELDISASYQIRNNLTADLIISDMNIDGKNTRFFINYDFNI